MSNSKYAYLASLFAIAFSGLCSAILGLFVQYSLALFFAGLAVALLPINAHLRMRRTLQALVRSGLGGDALSDDRVRSLESSISRINQNLETNALRASTSSASGDISRYANEMRREARMIRLLLEKQEK